MAVQIECAHCQSALHVGEELEGKLVRCPSCREATRVELPRRGGNNLSVSAARAILAPDAGDPLDAARAQTGWISVVEGFRPGREIALTKDSTTIGRAESCDVPLFGDRSIDKEHARIDRLENSYYLVDELSQGGTYLNDAKVKRKTRLQPGDRIGVGAAVLKFTMGEEGGGRAGDDQRRNRKPVRDRDDDDDRPRRRAKKKAPSYVGLFAAGLAVGIILVGGAAVLWFTVFADKPAEQPVAAAEPKKNQENPPPPKNEPSAPNEAPAPKKEAPAPPRKNEALPPPPSEKADPPAAPKEKPAVEPKQIDVAALAPKLPAVAGAPVLVGQFGHGDQVSTMAISDDGKLLVTGGWDKTARLWDVAAGKEIRSFAGHTFPVTTLALSGDGQWLATRDDESTANLWEVATARLVRQIKAPLKSVSCLAMSKDGRWLFAGGGDSSIRVWETATGKEVRVFQGHAMTVSSLVLSRNAKLMATHALRENNAVLWNVDTGAKVREIPGLCFDSCLALSDDGKWLAASVDEHTAAIFDARNGRQVRLLKGHAGRIRSASFTSDGTSLLTSSLDRTIRRWDVATGKDQILDRDAELSVMVRLSRDAKTYVALNFDDRHNIGVHDLATGNKLSSFGRNAVAIFSLALASDGKSLAQDKLATAAYDKSAKIWDLATGQLQHDLKAASAVLCLSFSADGSKLAGGSMLKSAYLWDGAAGKLIRDFPQHTASVHSIALSADGKFMFTGDGLGKVRSWNAETGAMIAQFVGHKRFVHAMLLSPNGQWLLTGSDDRTACLWDVATAKPIRTFNGEFHVEALAMTGDGKRLITASHAGVGTVWDAASGKELCRFFHSMGEKGAWAAYDQEGRYDSPGGNDVVGLHWVIGNETLPLSRFRAHHVPGLLARHLGHDLRPLPKVEGKAGMDMPP